MVTNGNEKGGKKSVIYDCSFCSFTSNRIDNYNHKNKLKFNYKKMKYQSKLNNLPKTDKYLDNKTLFLIKDSHHDTLDYPILQLGPERTNHKIENIWNNVSRRKHM